MPTQTIVEPVVTTDSKQAILDAAEQILALHGYAGLSMRELSRQSGLAKSTLYHYFQDKSEIYISVLERDVIIVGERLTLASQIDDDVFARLRAVILAYFEMVDNQGFFTLNVLRRMSELEPAHLNAIYNQHKTLVIATIADIIREGIDHGQIRPIDPEMTVISLFSLMNGYMVRKMICKLGLTEAEEREEDVIEHTIQLFLHGIVSENSVSSTQ